MSSTNDETTTSYNQEYRQDPNTSPGYIYNYDGADLDYFQSEIQPYLPAYVSFSDDAESDPLKLTADTPGRNSVPCAATIYPYPGDAPTSLPRLLTIALSNGRSIELTLIARIVSIRPIVSTLAPDSAMQWNKGVIERNTTTTFFAGTVLQEIIGPAGGRYALVAAFDSGDYQPDTVDGLADLPLPPGYTYESSILEADLTLTAERVADILICSGFNFQLYSGTPD